MAAGAGAQEALPLPRWDERAESVGPGPGAGFNELLPAPPASFLRQQGLAEEPARTNWRNEELSEHDLALFLRGSEEPIDPTARPPTPVFALKDMPGEALREVLSARADQYLLDPQHLLTEIVTDDLRRLLEFHASDARIHLYLLILDADQKLPDKADADRFVNGALARRDSCLAICPMGEPWRIRFLVSKSVHQAVTAENLSSLADDCVRDASRAHDAEQQLQRLAVKLSTRLFQLESSLGKAAPQANMAEGSPLREVTAPSTAAEAKVEPVAGETGGGNGLLGLILALLTGAAVWLWRRRQRRLSQLRHVWILPEVDSIPRLGGNFSGGTSAVIGFGRPGGRLA